MLLRSYIPGDFSKRMPGVYRSKQSVILKSQFIRWEG